MKYYVERLITIHGTVGGENVEQASDKIGDLVSDLSDRLDVPIDSWSSDVKVYSTEGAFTISAHLISPEIII